MLEKEAQFLLTSFSSAMPYLVYPDELRQLVNRERGASDSVESFVANLKKKISETTDTTRRTDGQIFLNELRRALQSKI